MGNRHKSRADCITETLTCLGLSSPRSISSTYRESAFGCCFTLTIWPTLMSSMSTVGSSPAFLAAAGTSLLFRFWLAPSCCQVHVQVRVAAAHCCSMTDVACSALPVIRLCIMLYDAACTQHGLIKASAVTGATACMWACYLPLIT